MTLIDNYQSPRPDRETHKGGRVLVSACDRRPRTLAPLPYNLLSHNCRFVFSANGSALWNPVTVTRHAFRYCYAVTLSPVTVTGHAFRYRYAVTLSPVTVTGHAFRYRYAVTLSPVFLRVCAPLSSEPRPLVTQQLSTWYKRHHRQVPNLLQAAPRDESPPRYCCVPYGIRA